MYYVVLDGVKTPIGTHPIWIKMQKNGYAVTCNYEQRQGVVINDNNYFINGRFHLTSESEDMIDDPEYSEEDILMSFKRPQILESAVMELAQMVSNLTEENN